MSRNTYFVVGLYWRWQNLLTWETRVILAAVNVLIHSDVRKRMCEGTAVKMYVTDIPLRDLSLSASKKLNRTSKSISQI